MEKIDTPINRLRRILNESGTISDLDWQEAIEAEQIEMMTAVDLFVNYRKFTEDAFKTWYAENYQEKYAAESQPPVSGRVCFSPDCFYHDKTTDTCVGDYAKCTVKQTHR